ncbi:peptidoglycan synthase FtsI domain protein [Mycobacterium xenopi 3993]|nr:peptidoglycan synthase FtsI domain protein [Mycobacterium xenopi 3993]
MIPGSYRNRHKAVNGSTVQLTIDDDIQFYVQQQVQQAKNLSGRATCRRWCWTPRPAKCWPWPTTTPSTRRKTSVARATSSWATLQCLHRTSLVR